VSLLVYGANGYTASLIARMAVDGGLRPILAGRNAPAVEAVARPLGLEARSFDLRDTSAVDRGFVGVTVVLHCAGPFVHTARPMVDACLRNRAAYLDVTGEVPVFEACAARDREARAAGVMLMPGVGFDVVPSDCLAAHLARRLPTATHLVLGISGMGQLSRGTTVTMIEHIHEGGLVRKDGRLTPVPAGHQSRRIDFGRGAEDTIAMPWGDVSTAYHSTRIPNITVFMALPLGMRLGVRLANLMRPILRAESVRRRLTARALAGPPGPSDAQRAAGACRLWGEVTDRAGRRAVSRLRTPEGYTVTALAALEITRRALGGTAPVGYQTPSTAYGADLILAIPGCERTDVPAA